MVDYERVTPRRTEASVTWKIAEVVSRYHLYRLMGQFQPQVLALGERATLSTIHGIRLVGQPLSALERSLRRRRR